MLLEPLRVMWVLLERVRDVVMLVRRRAKLADMPYVVGFWRVRMWVRRRQMAVVLVRVLRDR